MWVEVPLAVSIGDNRVSVETDSGLPVRRLLPRDDGDGGAWGRLRIFHRRGAENRTNQSDPFGEPGHVSASVAFDRQ